MTQWIHTYGMSNTDLRTIFKTFDQNFRYVSVWAPLFDDLVIIRLGRVQEPRAKIYIFRLKKCREFFAYALQLQVSDEH